jgi:hypothetical protein
MSVWCDTVLALDSVALDAILVNQHTWIWVESGGRGLCCKKTRSVKEIFSYVVKKKAFGRISERGVL